MAEEDDVSHYRTRWMEELAHSVRETELSSRVISALCDERVRLGKLISHYQKHVNEAAEIIHAREAYSDKEFADALVGALTKGPEGETCNHD